MFLDHKMRKQLWVMGLVFSCLLGASFADDEALTEIDSETDLLLQDVKPDPGPTYLRISAIVGNGDMLYVGIVDQRTKDSRLLKVGETFTGYKVTKIIQEEQAVHLTRGDEAYVMFLQGDETYLTTLSDVDEGDRWDPEAEVEEPVYSREDFLREHAVRLGMLEPDAPLPAEWTEPVEPEEALRRMAESVGMEVPPDALTPRTREDFLREHGPDTTPAE